MNNSDESQRIVYQTGLHWAMLLGPAMVIFIGWMVMQSKGSQSIAIFALGIFWGVCSSISLQRSRITLTADHLNIQVGFPWKRSLTIPLQEISQLTYNQPTLGAMLNFGKILLGHQGKRNFAFRFVPRPADLINAVQTALNALPRPEQHLTEESV
jgi:membrane protein YdbS with pleckstrin-like domain